MKNKAFSKLSAEEKETKILGALDRKTEGLLLPKELLAIAKAVSCLPLQRPSPESSSIPSVSIRATRNTGVCCPWTGPSALPRS